MDPSPNFALRLSLCEDLIKLGYSEKVQVLGCYKAADVEL